MEDWDNESMDNGDFSFCLLSEGGGVSGAMTSMYCGCCGFFSGCFSGDCLDAVVVCGGEKSKGSLSGVGGGVLRRMGLATSVPVE